MINFLPTVLQGAIQSGDQEVERGKFTPVRLGTGQKQGQFEELHPHNSQDINQKNGHY